MQIKPLHIISFENPFPADFGGVIDVYYKIKALHDIGFTIYLHCFYDQRAKVLPELKAITEEVYLYKKNKNPFFLWSEFPFPVVCRFQTELITNLAKVQAPILFEGLHTTMVLRKTKLTNPKFLRLHNIESNFYAGMSRNETNYFKKIAYYFASKKYLKYEKTLVDFNHVFALSCHENELAQRITRQVSYVPVFHGNQQVAKLSEFGEYALYHGDLRLADNKNAAKFLIEVFAEIPGYQLIIASSNGKKMIEKRIKHLPNIKFVTLQKDDQLEQLFANAHLNVMLSFQQSGTKLKVINALFKSRFCLVNLNMVDDPEILKFCEIAHTKEEFISKVNELINKPFLESGFRQDSFAKVLKDVENALKMDKFISNELG